MKEKFYCVNCGYQSQKWLGRCPQCKSWDSFKILKEEKKTQILEEDSELIKLSKVKIDKDLKITTDYEELDRVLGGGFVLGSSVLIGGWPGIGKSTLALQIASRLTHKGKKVLYISGEESLKQIKLRAQRLKELNLDFYILSTQNLKKALESIKEIKPDLVIVDSIQVFFLEELDSAPGSIVQVRECAFLLIKTCKTHNICLLLIGHVTKEGLIAGPKILEHMVDVVLYFEGESNTDFRILRAQKNRFGATNEIAVFEMTGSGLREVKNPSEYFLSYYQKPISGVCVGCVLEGTRPIFVEFQALVCKSSFGQVRRRSEGFDYNRFSLLTAVIEKKAGLFLANQDIFVNVAGGLKIEDPCADLALVSSIFSSFKEKAIPLDWCFMGEISLTGDLRRVNRLNLRLREAKKLGFKRVFLPEVNERDFRKDIFSEVVFISNIKELFSILEEEV